MAVHAGACRAGHTRCHGRTRLTLGSMRGAVGKVLGHRLRRVGGRRGDEAATVGLRPGIAIHMMDTRRARGAPGHGGQGHRTVFRRPSRGTTASRQRTGAASGTARGGLGTQQGQGLAAGAELQDEPAGNSKTEKLQGLRFDARCIRAASWTVPKRFQRSAGLLAVQEAAIICAETALIPGGRLGKGLGARSRSCRLGARKLPRGCALLASEGGFLSSGSETGLGQKLPMRWGCTAVKVLGGLAGQGG